MTNSRRKKAIRRLMAETGMKYTQAMRELERRAEAERERIKAAGAVSACCGAEYARRGSDGFVCLKCLQGCDLIGVIG